jgi:hypothetical protein
MALTENQKKANKLKIPWSETTTEDQLEDLIKIEEDKVKMAANDKKKEKLILQNIDGKDMDEKDYFMEGVIENPVTKEKTKMCAPTYFNRVCGLPVDREDMIEVFKKVFRDNAKDLLFYKVRDREIYTVIVPLAKSTVVGYSEDSLPGDFQKHTISFIADGSVNLDTLKLKLRKIAQFFKRSE